MVKVKNVVYDEKPLQQAYLKKQLYGLCMKEGTTVLEHLNFFKKVISELLTVDIKIDEEDKVSILFSSLSLSYDHTVTTM